MAARRCDLFNREESPKFPHPLLASADETLIAAMGFDFDLKKPVFVQNRFGKFFGGAMLCDYLSAHVVDCLLAHAISAERLFKSVRYVCILQIPNANIANRSGHRAGEFSACPNFSAKSNVVEVCLRDCATTANHWNLRRVRVANLLKFFRLFNGRAAFLERIIPRKRLISRQKLFEFSVFLSFKPRPAFAQKIQKRGGKVWRLPVAMFKILHRHVTRPSWVTSSHSFNTFNPCQGNTQQLFLPARHKFKRVFVKERRYTVFADLFFLLHVGFTSRRSVSRQTIFPRRLSWRVLCSARESSRASCPHVARSGFRWRVRQDNRCKSRHAFR